MAKAPQNPVQPSDGQPQEEHDADPQTLIGRARHEAEELVGRAKQEAEELTEAVKAKIEEIKPKLRGWIHAASAPLTLAAGIVLVVLSPTVATKVGSAIFMATSVLLFTVSGIYHRGNWGPRAYAFLKRFDHANIYLFIAGSYTPFTLLLLDGRSEVTLLAVVWTGAILGVFFRIFWHHAPRWLYVPIYVALGWAAVIYAGEFSAAASNAVMSLMLAGGLLYTLGAVIYGLKRPNPWPSWFGFHEIFHVCTIAAFITHYIGISLATYQLR